ncbi:hypothetical protein HK097_003758 [Rhizophlyctis rosea]|uniref:Uncharacterized protein n=1 Tax=Rhizophlyctis rosea TaxID=64517 RepID=A0AAD5SEI7_9FUNG|nr:hypothetical protein HK097_003758 [Rhizophlyctis rosea]
MHSTSTTTLILALVATVASQDACLQDPTASSCSSFTYSGASSKLTSLCSQPTTKNLPACDWFVSTCSSTASSSAQCDAFSILNAACKDASVGESNADCTEIRGLCKNGTVVTQCQKVITGLPDARNASAAVASICREMPDMASCQPGCPAPSATTLVSDCNVLDVYSRSCLEMPTMNQCAPFTAFCAANNKAGPRCGGASPSAAAPSPTATGKSGSSGASSLAPSFLVGALVALVAYRQL